MNCNTCNGSTNQSGLCVTLLDRNPALAIPYVTLMAICSVSGTFGNILVIVSILKTKKLRTIGNAFLINMAVSDLGVTTLVDVSALTGVLNGRDGLLQQPIPCQMVMSTAMISCVVTIGSIIIVSLHRYVIICFFSKSAKIFSKTSAGVMIAATWLIGIIYNLRFVLKLDNDGNSFDPKLEQCFYDRKANSWLIRIMSLLTLVVVTFSYSGIFHYVHKHRRQMRVRGVNKERANSIRLAYTLLLTVVMFFICVMPFAIITIADKADRLSQETYMVAILFLYSGSSVNWIVYGLSNRQIRAAFKRSLCPTRS